MVEARFPELALREQQTALRARRAAPVEAPAKAAGALHSLRAVPRRVALAALLAAVLAAPALRRGAELPPPPRRCAPEGRGVPPRHWLGCATDAGPRRALADDERLLLGLPLDPNAAAARELAFVPGLSRALAEAIVAERDASGPFASLDDLLRVRGIGPKRLARARPHLALGAP